MLFNSVEFFLFFPIVLAVYLGLTVRYQNVFLLIASYLFYGFWDARFLLLIFLSTLIDFFVGRALARTDTQRHRKLLLGMSLLSNLGILGFFKYFDFFVDSLAVVLGSLGVEAHLPTLRLLLPVGISFYTFQTLSYTFDIYRRKLQPTQNFLTFALFVAYFPQLVAGPIERAKDLLPRLSTARSVTWPGVAVGLELMLIGYLKKVGVADTLGPIIDARFQNPSLASGSSLLLSAYLFSIQIYCDFSGYSDIARGVSKLFGIPLMRNFNQPYLSTTITEFWRRWHISLSSWLRDYLYIALGGNRNGTVETYRNLMLTMLLGGLWHGANWTFVVWGGLHGLYLAIHKAMMSGSTKKIKSSNKGLIQALKSLLLFQLVTFTWIFFRSPSFEQAFDIIYSIVTWQSRSGFLDTPWLSPRLLILVGTVLAIDVWQARRGDHAFMVSWRSWPRSVAYATALFILLTFGNLHGNVPFIYFQF